MNTPLSSGPNDNPYAASQTEPSRPIDPKAGVFAPCPRCNQPRAKKVSWTLWGGALGPAMMHHVRCQSCSTTYNGKTGKSNDTAIAIYIVVSALIAFAIGLALFVVNLM